MSPPIDHHVLKIDIALPGGEALGHFARLLLCGGDLVDGAFEHRGKVGAIRGSHITRRLAAGKG